MAREIVRHKVESLWRRVSRSLRRRSRGAAGFGPGDFVTKFSGTSRRRNRPSCCPWSKSKRDTGTRSHHRFCGPSGRKRPVASTGKDTHCISTKLDACDKRRAFASRGSPRGEQKTSAELDGAFQAAAATDRKAFNRLRMPLHCANDAVLSNFLSFSITDRAAAARRTGRTARFGLIAVSSAQRRLRNHKIKRENRPQGQTSPARRVLAGKLPPSGRLHGAAVSHREGHDLGGTGGNLRSAGEQCRELAGSPGEAAHASLVRPVLCRESREAAGGGRAAERATRRQPGWVSGPLMRF